MPAGAFGTFVKTRPTGLGQTDHPSRACLGHPVSVHNKFFVPLRVRDWVGGRGIWSSQTTRTHTPRSADEHLLNASGYRIGFRQNWRVLAAPRGRRGALSSLGIRLACLTFVAVLAAQRILGHRYKIQPYIPNFSTGIQHFCIHAGNYVLLKAIATNQANSDTTSTRKIERHLFYTPFVLQIPT